MMEKELKIRHIVNKLKELCCPLVGNRNDVWLCNALFKPGFERLDLIEWFLKQLEVSTEEYENLNSLEEKTQSLLDISSGFGFCSEKDFDIIEGTAPVQKQVTFWDLLVNSLHKKYSLSNSSIQLENTYLSNHEKCKPKQYDDHCSYVSKVCESINLSHIFTSELQLLPIYLTKEIKKTNRENGISPFSVDTIKIYSERRGLKTDDSLCDSGISLGNKSLELYEIENKGFPHEDTVKELEEEISKSLCDLINLQGDSFSTAYDSLRLYFPEVTSNDFTDIGPSFKHLNEKLNSILMLKNSATSLKCSDSDLSNLNFEITGLDIPPEILSDTKLEEYIRMLSETENKE